MNKDRFQKLAGLIKEDEDFDLSDNPLGSPNIEKYDEALMDVVYDFDDNQRPNNPAWWGASIGEFFKDYYLEFRYDEGVWEEIEGNFDYFEIAERLEELLYKTFPNFDDRYEGDEDFEEDEVEDQEDEEEAEQPPHDSSHNIPDDPEDLEWERQAKARVQAQIDKNRLQQLAGIKEDEDFDLSDNPLAKTDPLGPNDCLFVYVFFGSRGSSDDVYPKIMHHPIEKLFKGTMQEVLGYIAGDDDILPSAYDRPKYERGYESFFSKDDYEWLTGIDTLLDQDGKLKPYKQAVEELGQSSVDQILNMFTAEDRITGYHEFISPSKGEGYYIISLNEEGPILCFFDHTFPQISEMFNVNGDFDEDAIGEIVNDLEFNMEQSISILDFLGGRENVRAEAIHAWNSYVEFGGYEPDDF
jgi:hypothetical protein